MSPRSRDTTPGPNAWDELVEMLQLRSRGALSQQEAARLLELLGERVASLVLLRGRRVVWRGLGVFYARRHEEKRVRTPPPGVERPPDVYVVPERIRVAFRPGKHSRRDVGGGGR